jgi:phosphatidylinositol-3-phosphatase
MRRLGAVCVWVVIAALAIAPAGANAPHASNVVVVVLENRSYERIIGSPDAPYINGTLVRKAALMTNSHAIAHPSEPNYLALFSGSTQGVTNDSCPHEFSAENAGAQLINAGKTFAGYSESMPNDGYTACFSERYARKHNPWVNFTNVPATSNLVYTGFVTPPPTLAIVVPNLCNDMHDCSTRAGDAWLAKNAPAMLRYNEAHDGLLILTWDEAEPDAGGANRIATLLIGPMVRPGRYDQRVTHYSVLHTIEAIAGLPCTGDACRAPVLTQIWR